MPTHRLRRWLTHKTTVLLFKLFSAGIDLMKFVFVEQKSDRL